VAFLLVEIATRYSKAGHRTFPERDYSTVVGLLVKSGHRMVAMVAFWSALCEHRDVAMRLSSGTAMMRRGQ
jgi:hypothetical protein